MSRGAILDHIAVAVWPALRRYLAAEQALTDALATKDAKTVGAARQDVMLAGRQVVDLLHHLSDFVLKEPSPVLTFKDIAGVRNAVEAKCFFSGMAMRVADVHLLRDIATN